MRRHSRPLPVRSRRRAESRLALVNSTGPMGSEAAIGVHRPCSRTLSAMVEGGHRHWSATEAQRARTVTDASVAAAGHEELPLFRIKDHGAGPATEVSWPAQRPAMYADRRRCTWMYETRNETAQICFCTGYFRCAGVAPILSKDKSLQDHQGGPVSCRRRRPAEPESSPRTYC
jgi:hypothetical protein